MQNLPYIIEYIQYSGQISETGNLFDFTTPKVKLSDNGSGTIITLWNLPEPQPTLSQLQTIENSVPFQSYLASRINILAKKKAKILLDELLKEYALVSLKEVNFLREWTRGQKAAVNSASGGTPAAIWADYKAKINLLPTLDDRTIAQLKTAIDNL